MYSVKLNADGYYTGTYVKTGSVTDGVYVYALPPTDDNRKALYYQWKELTKEDPSLVPNPGEEGPVIITYYDWVLDVEKYNSEVLAEIKEAKIKFIDSYKHEARLYFSYDGGVQRFSPEDVQFIQMTMEALTRGIVSTVSWKYPDGTYREVSDVKYFDNMLTIGGMLINTVFTVEKQIIDKINAILSIEELNSFDEKLEFDKLYNVLRDQVIQAVLTPQA